MGDAEIQTEQPKRLAQSRWMALRNLVALGWWRASAATIFSFAPSCITPAVFSMLSGAILLISTAVGISRLYANPVGLSDLILATCSILLGGLLTIAFLILSFGSWLMRLSAYSVALISAQSTPELGNLPQGQRKIVLKNAMIAVEPKRVHIGAVLLWSTLYMMPPFILFAISIIGKLITMPEFMGQMALKLPDYVSWLCYAVALPNFLFLMIFSIVSLVVAACSPLIPKQSAHLAFSLSLKYFVPLSLVTLVFSALGLVLGAPSDLMQMATLDKISVGQNTELKVAMQVWQSAINIILFPLSFTPFCDVLRCELRDGLIYAGGNIFERIDVSEQPLEKLS